MGSHLQIDSGASAALWPPLKSELVARVANLRGKELSVVADALLGQVDGDTRGEDGQLLTNLVLAMHARRDDCSPSQLADLSLSAGRLSLLTSDLLQSLNASVGQLMPRHLASAWLAIAGASDLFPHSRTVQECLVALLERTGSVAHFCSSQEAL